MTRRGPAGSLSRIAAAVLVALSLSTAALADTELSIQTGARFGETDKPAPVYGLTLDFDLAPEKWLSVIWSMQDTEITREFLDGDDDVLPLDIHFLEFAGVYRPTPKKGKTRGFVTAGGGVAWVSPKEDGFDSGTGLTLMVGGGAIVPLGKSVGLRFDARAHFILTEISLSGVCGGVGCAVEFSSGGTVQFEGLIGLSIAF